MSTDYAEKEREFISELADDTGRNLAGWMSAIQQSGHGERNAIIDWLRHQGFTFARASWLERIHHNGGQLIYARDAISPRPAQRTPLVAKVAEAPIQDAVVSQSQDWTLGDLRPMLDACKGLRPLAEHMLREVNREVEGLNIYAGSPYVILAAPLPFAALLLNPRKLRLFADFGPFAGRVKPAEAVGRGAPPFSGMLLFDDAREIDEDFRRLVRLAAGA